MAEACSSQVRQIQAIDKASVAKICSGQVILDLATAVKELVENALDAGATTVEVRLKEHGLQLIEVADNGRGVKPEDYAALALKYHTSKLSQFNDLESLHTFGFRGEALSSLAALAELSVITRTADQAAATRLEFDKDGRLVGSTPCARGVGTTIAIKDLFAALPVRRQELARNVRREVAKLRLLLQQYAILAGQAQLFASDQAGRAGRVVLVSTSNAGCGLRERVSAVLGAKVATLLQPLEFEIASERVKVSGLVSRAGCGVKGEKLRQFVCINGRPVELPRAVKTLNDTYKSLYSSLVGLRPLAFLCFELPPGTYDVNVTPDKRSVFIQKEVAIMAALGQALQALWEPSRYSYALNTSGETFDTQRAAAAAAVPAAPAAAAAAAAVEEEEDEEVTQEEAAEDERPDSQAAAGAAGGAAGGPPSLASFMIRGIGQQHSSAAGGHGSRGGIASAGAAGAAAAAAAASAAAAGVEEGDVEQAAEEPGAAAQQESAAPAAAAVGGQGTCGGGGDVGDVGDAAAAGSSGGDGRHPAVKRMRPLEAALLGLGKSARARHGSSSAVAAAAVAAAVAAAGGSMAAAGDGDGNADGSDGELSDGGEEDAGVEEEHQQQRQQQQEEQGDPEQENGSEEEQEEEADADGDEDEKPENGTGGSRQVAGSIGSWQQQRRRQQQQQQQAAALNLAAFSMHGSSSLQIGSEQQQQQHQQGFAAEGLGMGAVNPGSKGAAAADQRQRSLAACGFQVTVVEAHQRKKQQQQQQQQQCSGEELTLAEQDVGLMQVDAAAGAAGDGTGNTAAAAAVSAEHEVVVVSDDEGGGEDERAGGGNLQAQQQQQQQQRVQEQQQQQQQCEEADQPAVVLQYSLAQLMCDVQGRMRQQQQRQQQQQQQGAGLKLAAASLQGAEDDAAADADAAPSAAAAASACDAPAAAAAAGAGNGAATAELSRVFDKADFAVMQPLGQFNLGFIIARLKQDLFIVDQHAAGEKSTFERLLGSYSVNKQPLLQPRRLTTLTHMDQQVIRDNMEVFRRNGFEFVEQQQQQQGASSTPKQQQQQLQASTAAMPAGRQPSPVSELDAAAAAAGAEGHGTDAYAAAGAHTDAAAALGAQNAGEFPDANGADADGGVCVCELLLSAVPLVRGSGSSGVLGEEVLAELLDLIAAGERRPEDLRPKRVRDMLASRACRTSIMIGSPLTQQQQGRILSRMAQLDAPWNCPHGRPTMRHLAVLPLAQNN